VAEAPEHTPGGQEYHTHEYNRVTIPTSEALAMLHEMKSRLSEIDMKHGDELVEDAIHDIAFRHGIRMA
jgi:hypothetical protein